MVKLINVLEHLRRAEQLELAAYLDGFSRDRQQLTFKVASQSQAGRYYTVNIYYTVNSLHTYFTCDCEDHRIRARPCKHIVYLVARYYHRIREFHERTQLLKELKTALRRYNNQQAML